MVLLPCHERTPVPAVEAVAEEVTAPVVQPLVPGVMVLSAVVAAAAAETRPLQVQLLLKVAKAVVDSH